MTGRRPCAGESRGRRPPRQLNDAARSSSTPCWSGRSPDKPEPPATAQGRPRAHEREEVTNDETNSLRMRHPPPRHPAADGDARGPGGWSVMKIEHVGGCNEGCHGDDHLLLSETPAGGHAPDGHFAVSPVGSEREVAAVPPAGPAHRRAELIDVRARWIEGRVQRRIERSSLRAGDVDLDAWSEQAEREWIRAHPALEAWLAEGGGGGE